MHVCLTCIELFGDSVYGGFGRATRFVGRELARRGVEVSIVVPRRSADYPSRYELDGVTVYQYDPYRPWEATRLFRSIGADVYHSQDTSIGTALAPIARPSAAHVITFRDPMDRGEWQVESAYADMPRVGWMLYRQFITNPFVTLAVRRADGLYCAAKFLAPKAPSALRPAPTAGFPALARRPARHGQKADRPTVCYVGRWEGRKRVELFFELARQCPDVEFVAVGARAIPAVTSVARAVRRHREPPADRRPRPVRNARVGRGARAELDSRQHLCPRGPADGVHRGGGAPLRDPQLHRSRRLRDTVRPPGGGRTARGRPPRPAARRPVGGARRGGPAATSSGSSRSSTRSDEHLRAYETALEPEREQET